MKKKLNKVAKDINLFLKKFLLKQKKSNLLNPMIYGLLPGGKKIRSKLLVDVGKIFKRLRHIANKKIPEAKKAFTGLPTFISLAAKGSRFKIAITFLRLSSSLWSNSTSPIINLILHGSVSVFDGFIMTDKQIDKHLTLPEDKNGILIGPVTVATGIGITIESGATLLIA